MIQNYYQYIYDLTKRDKLLMVMRPYQIYAVERIIKRALRNKK